MEELNKNSISKNKNDTILSWIKYLETIRGYGEHTLDAYKRDVSEFSNFCSRKNYEFLSPDKYIFREFLSVLSERQLSRPTVARKVSSLKNFYQFLINDIDRISCIWIKIQIFICLIFNVLFKRCLLIKSPPVLRDFLS